MQRNFLKRKLNNFFSSWIGYSALRFSGLITPLILLYVLEYYQSPLALDLHDILLYSGLAIPILLFGQHTKIVFTGNLKFLIVTIPIITLLCLSAYFHSFRLFALCFCCCSFALLTILDGFARHLSYEGVGYVVNAKPTILFGAATSFVFAQDLITIISVLNSIALIALFFYLRPWKHAVSQNVKPHLANVGLTSVFNYLVANFDILLVDVFLEKNESITYYLFTRTLKLIDPVLISISHSFVREIKNLSVQKKVMSVYHFNLKRNFTISLLTVLIYLSYKQIGLDSPLSLFSEIILLISIVCYQTSFGSGYVLVKLNRDKWNLLIVMCAFCTGLIYLCTVVFLMVPINVDSIVMSVFLMNVSRCVLLVISVNLLNEGS